MMQIIGEQVVGSGGMVMPFSCAVASSCLVFTSGQLALKHGTITGAKIAEQTELVFDNLEAVLDAAGATLQSVVKTTVWLVRHEDFSEFNAVYARRFGDHRPARSTVVSQLVAPGALVEIEAIAHKAR